MSPTLAKSKARAGVSPVERDGRVYCGDPQCETLIGSLVHCGPLTLIRVGGLLLSVAHGVCDSCHAPFHWVAAGRPATNLTKTRG